jgi:hypothetical protein
MTLEALWGSYVFIIGGLGGVATLLSNALNAEAQQQLSHWLKGQVTREPRSFVQAANRAFLVTFDWLFASRGTALEGALWFALMLSPIVLILTRLAFLVRGVDVGDATDLLLFALCLMSALAAFLFAVQAEGAAGFSTALVTFAVVIALGRIALGPLGGLLVSIGIGLFVGTMVGAVFSRGAPGVGLGLALGCGIFIAIAGLLSLALEAFTGIGSFTLSFGLIGLGLGFFIGGAHILGPRLASAGSPIRTFIYSLFFIALVALLRWDAALAFLEDIRMQGPRLLVFVAFTVFADGVSLLETRWILRRAMDVKSRTMVLLLGVDLVLSALIFLFLPLVLGEIPAFFQAMLFRGDRLWLGILFWSSFSTSVMFYVFVLTSLLIRPLAHAPRLARYLAIDTKPVLILTIAVGVAITVIYLVGFGLGAAVVVFRGNVR